MKRVLCIDNKPKSWSRDPKCLSLIKEGVEYEVERVVYGFGLNGFRGQGYFLVGINSGMESYHINRFIPLSETEFKREYNYQTEVK